MNINETKYFSYFLCREMLETVKLVADFNPAVSQRFTAPLKKAKRILITGEGSSRIFPGKNFKDLSLSCTCDFDVIVEGATQALEFQLNSRVVFGVSNSGKTKELVKLFSQLVRVGHTSFYGLTATASSPITQESLDSEVLTCGEEKAVAATKSVIEQALFFESLFYNFRNSAMPSLTKLAQDLRFALEMPVDKELVEIISKAPVLYFAGRNNGVAEELALKTNEITRKKSVFLEGTYALHGIEEVMQKGEVLLVIDPFEQEESNFLQHIKKGVGVHVIAISSRKTIFPTLILPENHDYKHYIELAGGWNILVEVGLSLGIDLDKPIRARKIGNEAVTSN